MSKDDISSIFIVIDERADFGGETLDITITILDESVKGMMLAYVKIV